MAVKMDELLANRVGCNLVRSQTDSRQPLLRLSPTRTATEQSGTNHDEFRSRRVRVQTLISRQLVPIAPFA